MPIVKQRSLRYQILGVADKSAFVERTGIAWTPGLVVLDSQMHVRLAPERATATAQRQVVSFFGGDGRRDSAGGER